MRTYDDTFSGQRIYPGKVHLSSIPNSSAFPQLSRCLYINSQQQQQALAPNIGYQTEQGKPR